MVANLEAAMRDPAARIDLAALETDVHFPDPATFLAEMFDKDIPAVWLPRATPIAVARLQTLSGNERDHAAEALAHRLETRDIPAIPYAVPTVDTITDLRLGCKIWNGVDQGFDLAGLCLKRS
jgi:hypothetical protein